MKSILEISLLILALCCGCRSKEKIVLERTEASRIEAQHETIDYDITINDVIVDDSGKISIKPTKKINIKGNRVDTTQSLVTKFDTTQSLITSNKIPQPIHNANKAKSKFKPFIYIKTFLFIVIVLSIIIIAWTVVKKLR